MSDIELPALKLPKVVYVGAKRFHAMRQVAIDVSHATRVQITPSHVIQFLIDNMSDADKEKLKASLINNGAW